jgi:uncharacterized membrane protein
MMDGMGMMMMWGVFSFILVLILIFIFILAVVAAVKWIWREETPSSCSVARVPWTFSKNVTPEERLTKTNLKS